MAYWVGWSGKDWKQLSQETCSEAVALVRVRAAGGLFQSSEIEWRRKKEIRFSFEILPMAHPGPSTVSIPTRCLPKLWNKWSPIWEIWPFLSQDIHWPPQGVNPTDLVNSLQSSLIQSWGQERGFIGRYGWGPHFPCFPLALPIQKHGTCSAPPLFPLHQAGTLPAVSFTTGTALSWVLGLCGRRGVSKKLRAHFLWELREDKKIAKEEGGMHAKKISYNPTHTHSCTRTHACPN